MREKWSNSVKLPYFLLELDVVLPCDPSAVATLNLAGVAVKLAVADLLEKEERLGVLDEDLGPAHLVLVRVHTDRVEQVHHAILQVTVPLRVRLLGQDRVPPEELAKLAAKCEARAPDSDVLLEAEVPARRDTSESESRDEQERRRISGGGSALDSSSTRVQDRAEKQQTTAQI